MEIGPDTLWSAWLTAAAAVAAMMTLVWLVSLAKRDVSIVDIFWSLGFVLAAWIYHLHGDAAAPRRQLVLALVTIWGLRLALYIARRGRGQGEDYRYAAMREGRGPSFAWQSYFTVFLLQGALILVISPPLLLVGAASQFAGWTWSDAVGVVLWAVGFFFEAVGDWQMARFKADPDHRGRVLDTGLWRYTRHPNYFGDAMVWWGFYAFALAVPGGAWTLPAPLLMNLLLLKVSGVALLEKTISERRPKYRDYVEATNAFLPWFPRRRKS